MHGHAMLHGVNHDKPQVSKEQSLRFSKGSKTYRFAMFCGFQSTVNQSDGFHGLKNWRTFHLLLWKQVYSYRSGGVPHPTKKNRWINGMTHDDPKKIGTSSPELNSWQPGDDFFSPKFP
jgi:hypothetical protein